MFSTEVHVFWPLALLLLSWRPELFLNQESRPSSRNRFLTCSLILGLVYGIYLTGFILTRTAAATSGAVPQPGLLNVIIAAGSSLFNLVYNGILVNIFPSLAIPGHRQR